jgi:CBS domain-containing protein
MTKTVEDIMTRRVIFVREEDSIQALREGMEAYGLRHIPVLDGDKVVGLLSHRDMLRLADSEFHPTRVSQSLDTQRTQNMFVADVMTRDIQIVPPDMPLAVAAQILLSHKFGCLPVTASDGTLLGIVTEHDFVKVLVDMLRKED